MSRSLRWQIRHWEGAKEIPAWLEAALGEEDKRFRYSRKPKKCPVCGSKRVVEILYGYPTYSAYEKEQAGAVVLGGCVITEDDPSWQCLDCGMKLYPKRQEKI